MKKEIHHEIRPSSSIKTFLDLVYPSSSSPETKLLSEFEQLNVKTEEHVKQVEELRKVLEEVSAFWCKANFKLSASVSTLPDNPTSEADIAHLLTAVPKLSVAQEQFSKLLSCIHSNVGRMGNKITACTRMAIDESFCRTIMASHEYAQADHFFTMAKQGYEDYLTTLKVRIPL